MEESSDSEDDSSPRLVVVEEPRLALRLLARGFGEYHYRFVESSLAHGARALLAVSGETPVGAAIGFTAFRVGVVYYVYVEEAYRGSGVGKTLVLSLEELLESDGAEVFVASTAFWNKSSMRMFDSLGYTLIPIESLEEKSPSLAGKVEKLACMEDDDVLMVKPTVKSLSRALSRTSSRDIAKIWVSRCYKPWLSYIAGELESSAKARVLGRATSKV
ncbi:MAG: GNAT family N-acetyltransferase [Acidilobaceae archaeon]